MYHPDFIILNQIEESISMQRGLKCVCFFYSALPFTVGDELYGLLMTFVNSLDPDQAQHNVGPDLDPNCLTLLWYS